MVQSFHCEITFPAHTPASNGLPVGVRNGVLPVGSGSVSRSVTRQPFSTSALAAPQLPHPAPTTASDRRARHLAWPRRRTCARHIARRRRPPRRRGDERRREGADGRQHLQTTQRHLCTRIVQRIAGVHFLRQTLPSRATYMYVALRSCIRSLGTLQPTPHFVGRARGARPRAATGDRQIL